MKTTGTPLNFPPALAVVKNRRWWLYLLTAFGALLALAGGAFVALLGYYTSKEPMPIIKVDVTEADREALTEKWIQFHQEVTEGRPTAPFKASPKELNVFFSMLPRYRDRIYLSLVENRMRAEVSMPLDPVLPLAGKGRYLNGADTFDVRLGSDGFPRVEIVSAQVNSKRLPRWLERQLGRKELHQDIFHVLGGAAFLGQLKSLEIRDGFVVIIVGLDTASRNPLEWLWVQMMS